MNELVAINQYAESIIAAWRSSVQGILDCGRLLKSARADLGKGLWGDLVERLPFGMRTAEMLIEIASDRRLSNANHGSLLPPHWRTMYELTRLDDDTFQARIDDGTIRPEMERAEITQEIKATKRAATEQKLAQKIRDLPTEKYGVIVSDPEWKFKPYSTETGMDRAADNHYPTSATEIIASRKVQDIAASDCILFLWATVPMLTDALVVLNAWGFTYKSNFVWVKNKIGTGYWNRNQHELLLVGTKGNIPAPAMGTQISSVIEAAVGRHSAKPEAILDHIESLYPNLPKIELNRRGDPREGWSSWGNETDHAAEKTPQQSSLHFWDEQTTVTESGASANGGLS